MQSKMAEEETEFIKKMKEVQDRVKTFIWNSETLEFCGRTGVSWSKIITFYIIFYFFLAGFWTSMLVIFYQTLDSHKPVWTVDESQIGTNPVMSNQSTMDLQSSSSGECNNNNEECILAVDCGITFRPRLSANSTWISIAPENATDWASILNKFLHPYQPGRQNGTYVEKCTSDSDSDEPRVCEFILEDLGNECTMQNNFGYNATRPCIAIKLNRIYGWKPEPYPNNSFPSSMPEHIRNNYDPNHLYISCEGEKAADNENIGSIKYYPENGRIPRYYFPFTNLDDYLSPFVFVQFENLKPETLINIECKAWAKNIFYDRSNKLGSVRFKLLIKP